jgi:hypothetical protein
VADVAQARTIGVSLDRVQIREFGEHHEEQNFTERGIWAGGSLARSCSEGTELEKSCLTPTSMIAIVALAFATALMKKCEAMRSRDQNNSEHASKLTQAIAKCATPGNDVRDSK